MANEYSLTEEELNLIKQELEKTFYYGIEEEGVKPLKIDIVYFEKLIQSLYTEYKSHYALLTSKTYINFSDYIDNINFKNLIMAYPLLMKFRQYLTQSEINYRIYSNFKDGNMVVAQFGTYDILEGLKLQNTKRGIVLGFNIEDIEKNQTRIEQLENFYNRYFPQIESIDLSQDFKGGKQKKYTNKGSLWRVHKFIYQRYIGRNKGLKQKKSNLYQVFNFGHLMEAYDITFTHILQMDTENIETINLRKVEDIYFGDYLSRDNIKGFHGGDNPFTNTQIKTVRGDIMNLVTILKELSNTYEIIIKIKNYLNTGDEKIKQDIKKLLQENFYEIEDNLDDTLEANVEKLIDEFKNVNTKSITVDI